MLEGYSVQTVFSLLVSCMPMVAFLVILGRRAYLQDAMVCLMGICLLSFFHDILVSFPAIRRSWGLVADNVHMLVVFGLVLLICQTLIYRNSFRRVVPTIAIATASIFITYILINGMNKRHAGFQLVIALLLLLAALVLLYQLMRYKQLQILSHPLFYLAIGIFFFYFQFLIIEVGGRLLFGDTQDTDYYSWLLMLVTRVVEYLFFFIAALMAPSYVNNGSSGNRRKSPYVSQY